MSDAQILNAKSEQITGIISNKNMPLNQQKDLIYNILKDIEGEILIQLSVMNGREYITRVDVLPPKVSVFQEFDVDLDSSLKALSILYMSYLHCDKTGETKPLFNALQNYQQVTNYPVTKSDTSDKDWMMLEASSIIEGTLIPPSEVNTSDNPLDKLFARFNR